MKPVLIIIAGPNGSGKTSVTTKVLQHQWIQDCVYINPDNIAKEQFGDWNDKNAVLQAAKLATQMREDCIAKGQSLIFETVLSAPDKIDFIEKAKKEGYFIRLFFIGTNGPEINAGRIARRVMEGGHDVPIPKIISRYEKSIANCCVAAIIADRTYVYDNSVNDAEAQLLFRVIEGRLVKIYGSINEWAQPILQFVEYNNGN